LDHSGIADTSGMTRSSAGSRTAIVGFLALLGLGLVGPPASAATGDVTESAIPSPVSLPQGIAVAPDGAIWFAERNANAIGLLSNGSFSEYPLPNPASAPFWITAGPDGNMWFTERTGNRIGSITRAGAISEFPLPTAGSQPGEITVGTDGAMWFTEQSGNRIGRITTQGQITEFPLPHVSSGPIGIAAGSDGAMWFTELTGNRIGRITTSGQFTEFPLVFSNRQPTDITAGADGNLWFTERLGNAVGRITPGGSIDEFVVPASIPNLVGIAAGPDGNVWFAELGGNNVGRVTPGGAMTEFPLPSPNSQPFAIALGTDGAMWFTEQSGNRIGRIEAQVAPPPDTTPPTIAITSPADGASFSVGQVVLADYACTDEVGGSGVASCDGPAVDGTPIDTSLGTHTFTVSASDVAGNGASASTSYVVLGDLGGQFRPSPAWNAATAGSALSISFDLGSSVGSALSKRQLNAKPGKPPGQAVVQLFAPGFPMTQRVDCGDPETTIGPGDTPKVDVNVSKEGHFHLVWKSEERWSGTCRALILSFDVAGWRDANLMFLVAFR
jgi:streptogramin lyase